MPLEYWYLKSAEEFPFVEAQQSSQSEMHQTFGGERKNVLTDNITQ